MVRNPSTSTGTARASTRVTFSPCGYRSVRTTGTSISAASRLQGPPAPAQRSTMRRALVHSMARRSNGPTGSYAPVTFSVKARKSVSALRSDGGQAARSWISTRCRRTGPKLDFAPEHGQFRAGAAVPGPSRRPQLFRADSRPRDVGGTLRAAARRAAQAGAAPRGRALLRRGRARDDPRWNRGSGCCAGLGDLCPGRRRTSLPLGHRGATGPRHLCSRRKHDYVVSLRTTPFHPRTAPLSEGQAWRRWAGYVVASAYELSHEREYHAIRSSAALF